MKPDRESITGFQKWSAIVIALLLTACSTMTEKERKEFLCKEWEKGTKNVSQLKASYSIVTGKQLILRSAGPRTGLRYVEGDLKQLAQEVDAACRAQNLE